MWQHRFSDYKATGIFSVTQAQLTAVSGWMWPNFELFRALMHVILTCKYEKDRMKNIQEKVATIFRRSMAGNTVVWDRIWPIFELIQAFMYVIIACMYYKDPIKNS